LFFVTNADSLLFRYFGQNGRVPRVSEAHVRARREQILQGALRCFARKGFQKTTMREVCREAALSPGAVYLYFQSKQAIVEALAREYVSARKDLLKQSSDAGTQEALSAFLVGLAGAGTGTGSGGPAARRAAQLDVRLWAESLDSAVLRRVLRSAMSELVDGLEAILRRGRERGEVPGELDPRGLALAIVSLMAGLSLHTAFDADFEPASYRGAVAGLLRAFFEDAARKR
jgi:AcrR family transcriptional regulator